MFKKNLNLFIIILGVLVAILSSYLTRYDETVLIVGILIMLFGLFRISTSIPSKTTKTKNKIDEEE